MRVEDVVANIDHLQTFMSGEELSNVLSSKHGVVCIASKPEFLEMRKVLVKDCFDAEGGAIIARAAADIQSY